MEVQIESWGQGPPLVLLYGSPAPRSHFQPLVNKLAADFAVHVVDLPGHGNCPKTDVDYTMDESLDAMELALRDMAGATVVGFSSGGYRALALAARAEVELGSVVVLGGMASLTPQERTAYGGFIELVESGADLTNMVVERFLSPVYQQNEEALAEIDRWLAGSRVSLVRELRALRTSEDLRASLQRIRCPIVARTGTADQAVPLTHAEELVALTSGTLEAVPGAGHMLLLEDFEGTLASVRRATGF